ncbi:carbohydrate ABC transporter permease [Mariniluteicoccus flavus]
MSAALAQDTAERPAPTRRKGRGRQRRNESLAFYGFISPWLIGLVLLTIFPLGYAFAMSLSSWDGVSPEWKWVGIQNYVDVMTAPESWKAMLRTLVLTAFLVPFGIIGGLGLALLLNTKVKLSTTFRTLVYLPSILPAVAATLVWKLLFNRDSGAINGMLSAVGLPIVNWFSGSNVFIVLIVVLAWGVGGGVLLNLAALQDVPQELYDAAKIDGAGRLSSFFAVTLPSISPIILFQVITGVIGAFQTFVPALLLSPVSGPAAISGVPEENRIYMVEVYAQYFAYSRYGFASAMLWLMTIVILIITFLTFRFAGKHVFYNTDPGKG